MFYLFLKDSHHTHTQKAYSNLFYNYILSSFRHSFKLSIYKKLIILPMFCISCFNCYQYRPIISLQIWERKGRCKVVKSVKIHSFHMLPHTNQLLDTAWSCLSKTHVWIFVYSICNICIYSHTVFSIYTYTHIYNDV